MREVMGEGTSNRLSSASESDEPGETDDPMNDSQTVDERETGSALSLSSQSSLSSKRLHWQFFLFSFSILCSVSSYSGLMDLQSSINISDAIGNKSLTLMSVSTIVFCLFVTPVMVQALGAKVTILTSQVCYLVYTLANFYPVAWILLPGGIFLGIADALLFTPALMYCTYYGRYVAQMRSVSSAKVEINKFVGYFWAVYQMNEIFSNMISTIILGIGKSTGGSTKSTSNATSIAQNTVILVEGNVSSSFLTIDTSSASGTKHIQEVDIFNSTVSSTLLNQSHNDFFKMPTTSSSLLDSATSFPMCGANDCYNQTQYESNMEKYVPLSSAAFYAMMGMYTFLAVIALPIMATIPGLPERKDKKGPSSEKKTGEQMSVYLRVLMKNSRRVACQFMDPQQLLLMPLTLYHGLYVSFISSEITRGYVSCTMGVEQVGLAMMAGGIANVAISFLFGHLSGHKFFRHFFLTGAIAMDLLLYFFCLLWVPTEDTTFYAYIICILFGMTDGVWSPFLDGKYAKYFPQNEEVAYSVHVVLEWCGFTLTYGWTMVLCIREKIYIQVLVLAVGVVGCVGAEVMRKKKERESLESTGGSIEGKFVLS